MTENLNDFIGKVHETQRKDQYNREHQGKGSPEKRLSNKQHSTNK